MNKDKKNKYNINDKEFILHDKKIILVNIIKIEFNKTTKEIEYTVKGDVNNCVYTNIKEDNIFVQGDDLKNELLKNLKENYENEKQAIIEYDIIGKKYYN